MTNKEYNGWYNYETWVVNLWMDNDEGLQDYWREQAEEYVKVDGREDAVSSLADLIKENHEEQWGEMDKGASVFSDLMGAALSEVNWYEIAQHLVDAVEVEEEETVGFSLWSGKLSAPTSRLSPHRMQAKRPVNAAAKPKRRANEPGSLL